jgi:hypothetical protein
MEEEDEDEKKNSLFLWQPIAKREKEPEKKKTL